MPEDLKTFKQKKKNLFMVAYIYFLGLVVILKNNWRYKKIK
jgi:hypothetical protein